MVRLTRKQRRASTVHLAAALAVAAILGGSSASAGQHGHGPNAPREYYWFRTDVPVPTQPECMDPRLKEISDASGRGDYQECRRLAESVILSPPQADEGPVPSALRAEAASFIIQSHLAEGDFDAARSAAERFGDQDALARVNNLEADYQAQVGRLQHIVATTKDPAEAARAQLLTAHTHRQVGRLEVAQESYWKVVSLYPNSPLAGTALEEIAVMHCLLGNPAAALTVCQMAADLDPDSHVAVSACETIVSLSTKHCHPPYAEAREALRTIALRHPRTRAADTARFGIGQLYLAEQSPEQAEAEWVALLAERPDSHLAAQARMSLAELRYSTGIRAFFQGDYAQAARWLERLLPDLESLAVSSASGQYLDDARPAVASKRRHALFSLGEAYQKIGNWEKAAEVFARLAVPGDPAEEIALFQLGRSKMEAGYHADALEAFAKLKDRFPESAYTARCEDYIRTIQGER